MVFLNSSHAWHWLIEPPATAWTAAFIKSVVQQKRFAFGFLGGGSRYLVPADFLGFICSKHRVGCKLQFMCK